MQVIEAQRASILEPHDHLHISHVRSTVIAAIGVEASDADCSAVSTVTTADFCPGAWVGSVSVSRCELRIWRSALRGARRLAGPSAGVGDQVGEVRTAGAWSSPMPVIGNVPWRLRPGKREAGGGPPG